MPSNTCKNCAKLSKDMDLAVEVVTFYGGQLEEALRGMRCSNYENVIRSRIIDFLYEKLDF